MNDNDSIKASNMPQHEYSAHERGGCKICGFGPGALIHNMTYTPETNYDALTRKLKHLVAMADGTGAVQWMMQCRLRNGGRRWESVSFERRDSSSERQFLYDTLMECTKRYVQWKSSVLNFSFESYYEIRFVPVITAMMMTSEEAVSSIDKATIHIWENDSIRPRK